MRCILLCMVIVAMAVGTRSADPCPQTCKCRQSNAHCYSLADAYFDTPPKRLILVDFKGKISSTMFAHESLSKLVSVEISSGELVTDLPEDTFANLTSLVDLVVRHVNVRHLKINSKSLLRLKVIDSGIEDFDLTGLPELQEVYISGNRIRKLSGGSFGAENQLAVVMLPDNDIEEIQPDVWPALEDIDSLDLSGNKLEHFDLAWIANSVDMYELTLARNPLKSLHMAAGLEASSLETLDVSFCNLTHVDVGPLTGLVRLNVSYNALRTFTTGAFDSLTRLETFAASHNDLADLPFDLFKKNDILLKVDLSYNRHLVQPPPGGEDTQHYRCRHCGIFTLTEAFVAAMPDLATVDMAHNNINIIGMKSIRLWKRLKQVDFSFNRIASVDRIFRENKELVQIDVSGNSIPKVSLDTFEANPHLAVLNMSACGLQDLSLSPTTTLKQLQHLSVSDNGLSTLDVRVLEGLPNLQILGIMRNDIQCDAIKVALEHLRHTGVQDEDQLIDIDSQWSTNQPDLCEENFGNILKKAFGPGPGDGDVDVDVDVDATGGDSDNDSDLTDDFLPIIKGSFAGRFYSAKLAFVFVGTAVLVLVVCVVAFLLAFPVRRGVPATSRNCGAVYRPLSEEKGPPTPKFPRYPQDV